MTEQSLTKRKFSEMFKVNPSAGTIEPREIVNISGVTIGPGVRFGPGVTVGGVNVFALKDRELAVKKDEKTGVNEIKGFYGTK